MINDFINEKKDMLNRLYWRWLHERKYEDFAEYVKAVKENFNKDNVTVLSMSKRFNIQIMLDDIAYEIRVRVHAVEYQRLT